MHTPVCTDKYICAQGVQNTLWAKLLPPGSKLVRGKILLLMVGSLSHRKEYSTFLHVRMTDFIKHLGNEIAVVQASICRHRNTIVTQLIVFSLLIVIHHTGCRIGIVFICLCLDLSSLNF